MELLALAYGRLDMLFVIFVRISGVFLASPLLSARFIPRTVKIGLAGAMAIILFNILPPLPKNLSDSLFEYTLLLAGELFIGFVIGFATSFIFAAIQLGGQIIDTQIGFGIVNIVDPLYGTQAPLLGNFKYILALLVYLATNSHHFLLTALYKSYEVIPIGPWQYNPSMYLQVEHMLSYLFIIAVQVAAPVLGSLFIADVALGILARTVPQMNVFVVGMPVKLVFGLAVMILSLPVYVMFLGYLFDHNVQDIAVLLKGIVK